MYKLNIQSMGINYWMWFMCWVSALLSTTLPLVKPCFGGIITMLAILPCILSQDPLMPSLKSVVHSPSGPCCQRSTWRDITMFLGHCPEKTWHFLGSHFQFLSSDIAKGFRARGYWCYCFVSSWWRVLIFSFSSSCFQDSSPVTVVSISPNELNVGLAVRYS